MSHVAVSEILYDNIYKILYIIIILCIFYNIVFSWIMYKFRKIFKYNGVNPSKYQTT